MVAQPWDYRWSSCRAYACGETDPLLAVNPWYDELAASAERRQALWRAFLVDNDPREEAVRRMDWVVGEPAFRARIEVAGGRPRPRGRGRRSRSGETSAEGTTTQVDKNKDFHGTVPGFPPVFPFAGLGSVNKRFSSGHSCLSAICWKLVPDNISGGSMVMTDFESTLATLLRRIKAGIPPPPNGEPELQLRFQALKEFVGVFLAANPQQKATVLKHAAKCKNELWVFSMDMAAEAVQTKNLEGVFTGLIALGLENLRTDERDTLRALSTLFHSIKKLHGSEDEVVQRVLPLVPKEFGRCLQEFASRAAEFKSIEIMGFEEGEIDGRFAYVDSFG